MVIPAVLLFFYGVIVWFQRSARFMLERQTVGAPPRRLRAWFRAIGDALTLKYMGGGGPGCSYRRNSHPPPGASITHWSSGVFCRRSYRQCLRSSTRILSTYCLRIRSPALPSFLGVGRRGIDCRNGGVDVVQNKKRSGARLGRSLQHGLCVPGDPGGTTALTGTLTLRFVKPRP